MGMRYHQYSAPTAAIVLPFGLLTVDSIAAFFAVQRVVFFELKLFKHGLSPNKIVYKQPNGRKEDKNQDIGKGLTGASIFAQDGNNDKRHKSVASVSNAIP